MRAFALSIPLLLLMSCSSMLPITTQVQTNPIAPFPTDTKLIVIGNATDITKESYRDKKEVLFKNLIDTTLYFIRERLNQNNILAVREPDSKLKDCMDDCQQRIITLNNASYSIIITNFNIYFEQMDIVVTKSESGKSREAFYDIVSKVDYILRSKDGEVKTFPIEARQFHSSRFVVSGLFSAGPNVVSNKQDVMRILHQNINSFIKNFVPATDDRFRLLFGSSEFKELKQFINRGDIQSAITFCEKKSTNTDTLIGARAFYNLAVLYESQGNYTEAKVNLNRSLELRPLPEARTMMNDYSFD